MRHEGVFAGEPVRPGGPLLLLVGQGAARVDRAGDYLGAHGYRVRSARDATEAMTMLGHPGPCLAIVGTGARPEDGLAPMRELQQRTDLPLIVVQAGGADEVDRILAFELGADDCVHPSIGDRELLARIRAVLRRCAQAVRGPSPTVADAWSGPADATARPGAAGRAVRFGFAGWTLDRVRREVRDPQAVPLRLTAGEFDLLAALLEAPMRPLSRAHLLEATRRAEDVVDRSIDVQVMRLRRRLLARDRDAGAMIVAERGIGYRFAVPVERLDPP